MGNNSCCFCCLSNRYVRLTEDVVLETDEHNGHTKGIYYFHPPDQEGISRKDIETASESGSEEDDMHAIEGRVRHRFHADMDASVTMASNIHPSLPKWTLMYQDPTQKTSIWEKAGFCHVLTSECNGVFAEELAKTFWDPDQKDWDPSIESYSNLETLTNNAYVAYYLFKPVWPAAQRESVLCSEIIELPNGTWAVSSQSVENETRPIRKGSSIIRIKCSVAIVIRQKWFNNFEPCNRKNSRCSILYTAKLELGGWVPHNLTHSLTIRKWPEAISRLVNKTREAVVRDKNSKDELFLECE